MKKTFLLSVFTAIIALLLSGCRANDFEISNTPNSLFKTLKIDSTGFNYNWISPTNVDFINSKTGYILCMNGFLLKTTDSIKSWTISNIDSTGVMTSTMSFISDSTGYVY